ncbi:hypothetical protein GQ600_25753 [Phytophthora cactorum]|nr:hypothetical protein GQ600_25753 [Phytophthora cactorum]
MDQVRHRDPLGSLPCPMFVFSDSELLKDSDEYLAVLVGPHDPPYDDYGASNETHVHADYGARGFRMEVD